LIGFRGLDSCFGGFGQYLRHADGFAFRGVPHATLVSGTKAMRR
jgi:hypothetical protein